jgi:predicted phosphohydrolase
MYEMKLIWMSDIHLNFLNEQKRKEFYEMVKNAAGDAVVISGDIAESHNVVKFISDMQSAVGIPIYFVLGNHDFYGSSVAGAIRSVKTLGYLGSKPYVALNDSTALLGVDGWGDCRCGDFENSRLTMSDWIHIDDLRKGYGKGMNTLKKALQKLADRDATELSKKVTKAIESGYKRIIIVTHVPPFEQCSLYAGRKSTPSGLPFFASKILGDTILPLVKRHSDIDFLWLSGHTHSRAKYKPCRNMVCKVAKAEYFFPQIEEVYNV